MQEAPRSNINESKEDHPSVITAEKAIEFINEKYPDLEIKNITEIHGGDQNVVFDADGKYIFRFARPIRTGRTLNSEVEILRILQNKFEISIPNPEYLDEEKGLIGYKKLEGQTANSERMAKMSEEERITLATDIAHFLLELHSSVTLEEVKEIGGIPDTWRLGNLSSIRKKFGDIKEKDEISNYCDQLDDMMGKVKLPEAKNTIIHQDLNFGNILLDKNKLSAVLDFGSVAIGDIHNDFISIFKRDPKLCELVIDAYNNESGEKVNKTIVRLSAWCGELRRLIRYKDNPESKQYKAALERLRKWSAGRETAEQDFEASM